MTAAPVIPRGHEGGSVPLPLSIPDFPLTFRIPPLPPPSQTLFYPCGIYDFQSYQPTGWLSRPSHLPSSHGTGTHFPPFWAAKASEEVLLATNWGLIGSIYQHEKPCKPEDFGSPLTILLIIRCSLRYFASQHFLKFSKMAFLAIALPSRFDETQNYRLHTQACARTRPKLHKFPWQDCLCALHTNSSPSQLCMRDLATPTRIDGAFPSRGMAVHKWSFRAVSLLCRRRQTRQRTWTTYAMKFIEV